MQNSISIIDALSDSVLALDEQLNIVAFNTAAMQDFVQAKNMPERLPLQDVIGNKIEEQKLLTSVGLYNDILFSAATKVSAKLGLRHFTSIRNSDSDKSIAAVELRAVNQHPTISWLLFFKFIEAYTSSAKAVAVEQGKHAPATEILNLREEQIKGLNNNSELQVSVKQHTLTQQAVLLHKEADLLSTIRTLEKENRELEQFNYLVIHDLQEPLRSMLSFSDLISAEAQSDLNEKTQTYLKYITESAKRMQALVGGLLKYAALGNESQLQLLDCNALVAEVKQDLAAAIAESGIAMKCQDLPSVNAYPLELKSVFLNLISNAIKFRNRQQVAEVSIAAFDQGDFWRFEVKDNGIGIDPKHHRSLFVLFKRFHRHADLQGTGIGLALCKKVIALHKGEIWAESLEGGGTGFFFTLPKSK